MSKPQETTFSNQPAGPESMIVRLAGARFRVNLETSACFKWTYAAFVSITLVCSLSSRIELERK